MHSVKGKKSIMTTIDILTSEMHLIHGANRVTEKLILGRDIFEKNGFNLRFVISQDGFIDCTKYEKSLLGSQMELPSYKGKRKIIESLKKLSIYNTYPIQKSIFNKSIERNTKVIELYNTVNPKPDIIIFQDPFTAYIALKDRNISIPSILISHTADDPLEQLLMNRPAIKGTREELFVREIYKYVFEHVSKVVTICHRSQSYMHETYGLECPCILNGIEDVTFSVSEKKSEKDGKLHIIILASVQQRKGQDLAIKALAELKPAIRDKIMLHIVGGGQGFSEMNELTQKLNLIDCVEMHGPVLEVADVLSSMDVFLLPSRADTVPIAIIEAMRSGLPIFATRVGEIPQMLDGCGQLIEPTVNSVLSTYTSLLNGEYDLLTMGLNARAKYLEQYNLSSMINKYCGVLKSIYVHE